MNRTETGELLLKVDEVAGGGGHREADVGPRSGWRQCALRCRGAIFDFSTTPSVGVPARIRSAL